MNTTLLIIDDDHALGQMLLMHFEDMGYRGVHKSSAQEGLRYSGYEAVKKK
jgi:ActR/RegA family two-component response regulator